MSWLHGLPRSSLFGIYLVLAGFLVSAAWGGSLPCRTPLAGPILRREELDASVTTLFDMYEYLQVPAQLALPYREVQRDQLIQFTHGGVQQACTPGHYA